METAKENDPQKSGRTETPPEKNGMENAAKRVVKPPFARTRRKIRSFRRNVKKLWDLWSGFTSSSKATALMEVTSEPTMGVPGFEEISCIEVEMLDLMMTDKHKIRTSCKQCLKNPPKFPTKEQVKSKLIAADKYYGVTKSKRTQSALAPMAEGSDFDHEGDYYNDDGTIERPSWRFILDRPLVEQYVLMTNYIRKISILSELESGKEVEFIEEEVSDTDLEHEKFTEQQKAGTKNLIAGMMPTPKKEVAVQTTPLVDGLNEGVSDASLYPDSNISCDSSQSQDQSAVTVMTSRDCSSPLQSDFENRTVVETVRLTDSVKWWESKNPPQTSESFPTSCDSVKNTSGSGSDGMSIPVHSTTGEMSLFKQHQPAAMLEVKCPDMSAPKLTDIRLPNDKSASAANKKVTFSPIVRYFTVPEKNGGVLSIPLPKNDEDTNGGELDFKLFQNSKGLCPETNTTTLTRVGEDVFHNTDERENITVNQAVDTGSHKHLNRKEGGLAGTGMSKSTTQQKPTKLKQLQEIDGEKRSGNKCNLTSEEVQQVSQSSSSRTNEACLEMKSRTPSGNKGFEENNKESSSSSDRLTLRPSPAGFFRQGEIQPAITSYSTDDFYPEVPEIDENELNSQKNKFPPESSKPIVVGCIPRSSNQVQIANKVSTDPPTDRHEFVKIVLVNQSPLRDANLELLDYRETTGINTARKAQILSKNTKEASSTSRKRGSMMETSKLQNREQCLEDTELKEDRLLSQRQIFTSSEAKDCRMFSGSLKTDDQFLPGQRAGSVLETSARPTHDHLQMFTFQQLKICEAEPTSPSRRVLRKICEENAKLGIEDSTCLDGSRRKAPAGGIWLDPDEEMMSVEGTEATNDKVKFHVFGGSQIYSSSSLFVTQSEERMAHELTKMDGTLSQPMILKENSRFNAPQAITSLPEMKGEVKTETQDSIDSPINSREMKNLPGIEEHEAPVFSQVCYNLIGSVQYATINDVVNRMEKRDMIQTTETLEVCHEGTITAQKAIVESILQRVHETRPTNDATFESNVYASDGERNTKRMTEVVEDRSAIGAVSRRKQWLMDVIPTLERTIVETPLKARAENLTSQNPANGSKAKPVFKFLKRQKELEENSNSK